MQVAACSIGRGAARGASARQGLQRAGSSVTAMPLTRSSWTSSRASAAYQDSERCSVHSQRSCTCDHSCTSSCGSLCSTCHTLIHTTLRSYVAARHWLWYITSTVLAAGQWWSLADMLCMQGHTCHGERSHEQGTRQAGEMRVARHPSLLQAWHLLLSVAELSARIGPTRSCGPGS